MACTHRISPNNMTSNTAPAPYVASSSGNLNTYQLPYCAFDNDITVWASDFPLPESITIDLGSSYIACAYGLLSIGQNHPVDWTFEGSTNGAAWDELDSQIGEDFDTSEWYTTIGNETTYRYYKWNFTETSHTNIALQEGKIYIETPDGVRDLISQGCIPAERS